MLRNTLFSLLILIAGKCYAQQDYFVLIQADNNQPFYVRLQDKTVSSTSKGRLTLSQLQSGTYTIIIGFPKQLYPEKQFSFEVGTKDVEFQLKNMDESGWRLYNPQTQEWKPAFKSRESKTYNEGIKKDDAFSRLMAGVVSDTAVMYNTYASTPDPAPKVDSATATTTTANPHAAIRVDSPAAMIVPGSDTISKTTSSSKALSVIPAVTPAGNVPAHSLGTVVKLSERTTPKGLRLAFADRPKGRKADTVIVIIPMDTSLIAKTKPTDSSQKSVALGSLAASTSNGSIPGPGSKSSIPTPTTEQASKKTDSSTTLAANPPAAEQVQTYKSDTLHLYTVPKKTANNKSDTSHTRSAPVTGQLYRPKPDSSQRKAESKLQIVNSDCRNFASDYDLDKLRVKMLEINKDDDRIAAAKKIFKTKCFTTNQIKALSEVFTTDGSKYRFFESSYPFVSDDRFRELADLLADPVYNGKFKAMTGQQ